MKQSNHEDLQRLLQEGLGRNHSQLNRDLWPRMLQRLEQASTNVPWFDWALLALLALWLLFAPKGIPVLLYHL